MVWNLGTERASPDGRPCARLPDRRRTRAARISRGSTTSGSTRFISAFAYCRTAPERDQLFFEGKRLLSCLRAIQISCASHPDGSDAGRGSSDFAAHRTGATGGNTSISTPASRRRRSRMRCATCAPCLQALFFMRAPATGARRSKPRFFVTRFQSPRPGSIRSRSPICIHASSRTHVFDGLYSYDHLARPFKIKPNTAAAMPEVSADFRVWTVKLRPGIYFQDDPAFKGQTTRTDGARLCLFIQALFRSALEVAQLSYARRAQDCRHGGSARGGAEVEEAIRL